jgi:hypothetical protein
VAIPGKDMGQAVSIQQLKDLLAAERARTENSFHEIKSLFSQFEKQNQMAIKDIQGKLKIHR